MPSRSCAPPRDTGIAGPAAHFLRWCPVVRSGRCRLRPPRPGATRPAAGIVTRSAHPSGSGAARGRGVRPAAPPARPLPAPPQRDYGAGRAGAPGQLRPRSRCAHRRAPPTGVSSSEILGAPAAHTESVGSRCRWHFETQGSARLSFVSRCGHRDLSQLGGICSEKNPVGNFLGMGRPRRAAPPAAWSR